MALELGPYTLEAVETGSYALDGGTMFGVVPRALWERRIAPDAHNRVRLAARCLLVRAARRLVLVDTGLGTKWSAKDRATYGIEGEGVVAGLARLGVAPGDVTDVVLTHLHFDAAGGATTQDASGRICATFPRATYHVQRRNWAWAQRPTERDRASYRAENCEALATGGRLHLIEGDTELMAGLDLVVSEGHTVGLQLVRVASETGWITVCSDVIPTSAHLKPAWHTAFDLYPLTVVEEKKMLVAQALDDDGVLFLEHDPVMQACRVHEEGGELTATPVELTRIA